MTTTQARRLIRVIRFLEKRHLLLYGHYFALVHDNQQDGRPKLKLEMSGFSGSRVLFLGAPSMLEFIQGAITEQDQFDGVTVKSWLIGIKDEPFALSIATTDDDSGASYEMSLSFYDGDTLYTVSDEGHERDDRDRITVEKTTANDPVLES